MNEVLLDQAVTIAILSRDDMSNDINNPAEVNYLLFHYMILSFAGCWYFLWHHHQGDKYNKCIRIRLLSFHSVLEYLVEIIFWSILFFSIRDHDLSKPGHESLTDDPEEAKLDYWREDSLFHAFHVLLHKIWNKLAEDRSFRRFNRTFELFFYAHQQMVRR